MSDFFEMRQAAEQALAAQQDRQIHGRFFMAYMVLLICGLLGLTHGIHKLEQPVGSVSTDYCSAKPCAVFTFTPNR